MQITAQIESRQMMGRIVYTWTLDVDTGQLSGHRDVYGRGGKQIATGQPLDNLSRMTCLRFLEVLAFYHQKYALLDAEIIGED